MSHREDSEPLNRALLLLDQPIFNAIGRLPLSIWIADGYGHVRWMNATAESQFGRPLGTHFSRFIGPDGVAEARALFARKIHGRLDFSAQQATLNTTAGAVAGEIISAPIREIEQVIGVVSFARIEARRWGPPPRRLPKPRLTPRQHQVLELLCRGYSTAQIAESLQVAEDTARNHIRLLLAELRVRTRLEAVVLAYRNGWL
jgi:DNA-binding CsgD family transcriptional regulator